MRSTPNSWKGQRKNYFVRWMGLALFCLAVLFVGQTSAQLTTADITGTVTDSTGSVLPNAEVTLTNLGTKESRTARSNGAGQYSFTLLLPGNYSVRIAAPNFKSSDVASLNVAGGEHARADASLQVGQASQTVEVVGQTPLLQQDNATVSSTISQQTVQNLPAVTHNLTSLIILTPGAKKQPVWMD